MSSTMRVNRRSALKMGAAAALASTQGIARGQISRPNILMIMSDQHRFDFMGAYGAEWLHTPHMDWLAQEGARFTCAYTSTPSCTPARAALLTGMSPWNHGMLGYGRPAVNYPVAMPQVLRDAGYYTMGIGKMHWHPQRNSHGFHNTILDESGRIESEGFRSDYRSWFYSQAPTLDPDSTGIGWNDYRARVYALPEKLHPTTWTGDTAVNFLNTYAGSAPFFLKVSFARPHSPYDPPERLMSKYEDAELPSAWVGDWADKHAPVGDPHNYTRWRGDMGAEQVRHSRQGYSGVVEQIDEQIGRIIETLDQRGMLDDTLILYFSDHGDMLGDHHLWRKTYAYEGSAKIPMLIRWPKGMGPDERGLVIEQPVELRDVLPTLADAAGAELPENTIDGRSMLDLIRGNSEGWRAWIDLEHDEVYARENHWSGLTDGRWKYIWHAVLGEEQLFDLHNDPSEERDLSSDSQHQAELRRWRERLVEHLAVRGDHYVRNGELAVRTTNVKYSPNYPREDS